MTKMFTLTNAMYATLVISIWSYMEDFLKTVARACGAASRNEKISVNFRELKKKIEEKCNIQIDQCNEYNKVNAIRILNNSFKHNRGFYKPPKPPEQEPDRIDESLLSDWSITANDEIEYSKLPINKLVDACRLFVLSLITKLRTNNCPYKL